MVSKNTAMKLAILFPIMMMIVSHTGSVPVIRGRRSVFDVIPQVENHPRQIVQTWKNFTPGVDLESVRLAVEAAQKKKERLKLHHYPKLKTVE